MMCKNISEITTMSIDDLNSKIEKQQEKLKQLKAQKQAIETREKKKLTEQKRKEDTRRKILLGSYLLKEMEDDFNRERILAELNEYLTEERDRQLFNLLPKEEEQINYMTWNLK